jgi:anti-anti-sigma factor
VAGELTVVASGRAAVAWSSHPVAGVTRIGDDGLAGGAGPSDAATETAVAEDCFVVRVLGRLDAEGAPVIQRAVSAAIAAGHAVTLDLSGLEFCDPNCVTALLAARATDEPQRPALVLFNVAADLRRTLAAHSRADALNLEEEHSASPTAAILFVGPSRA